MQANGQSHHPKLDPLSLQKGLASIRTFSRILLGFVCALILAGLFLPAVRQHPLVMSILLLIAAAAGFVTYRIHRELER